MSSVVIAGNTSGSVTLSAPDVAGTTTITLPSTSGTMATTSTLGGGSTSTTSSTDITLTSSSNKVQNVSMTAADKSVILPAATTLSLGSNIFVLVNNGAFPYTVKVSGGNAIAVVPVAGTVTLNLTDNSTAAGKWAGTVNSFVSGFSTSGALAGSNYGMSGNFAVTQSYPPVTVTSSQLNSAVYIDNAANNYPNNGPTTGMACNISATSALVVYQVSTTTYAVVITLSGGALTVGTPVAVLTGTTPSQVSAVVLSSTAAFVFAERYSSASGPLSIPLVLSGATITVGTSAAIAGTNINHVNACAMSSTIALLYNYDGGGYLRTVTHNGSSAPTIGSAAGPITQYATGGICKLTSTTALIAYSVNSSTVLTSRVVTISGSSAPTLGTALTNNVLGGNGNYPLNCYAYSPTEAIIKYNAVERGGAYSVTISGTTVTTLSYIDGPAMGYSSGYINGQLIGSSLDTSIYYQPIGLYSSRIARAKYVGAGTSSADLSVVSYNQLVVSEMTGATASTGCTYFDSSNILMLYTTQVTTNGPNYLTGLTANLITFV